MMLVVFSAFALVCLEVTGMPNRSNLHFTNTCNATYSCADCHTAKICKFSSQEGFRTIQEVRCGGNSPYCNPESGSCLPRKPEGCREEQTNAWSDEHINARSDGTSCQDIFSCIDCHTAQVCQPSSNGSLVVLKTLPCSEDRPFCDPPSGTCIAEAPLQCGTNGQFTCIHDGKFPDIDCRSYHTCAGSVSTTIRCGHNSTERYNPRTGVCDSGAPCRSFSCLPGNAGTKVPHPLDPRYFVFCGSNGPVAIDSCPPPYELNYTSQLCEATCHHNGLIQDLEDCHFYYKCTKVFLSGDLSYFQKERKRCPEDQAFDPSEYLCVSETSNIPGCKD